MESRAHDTSSPASLALDCGSIDHRFEGKPDSRRPSALNHDELLEIQQAILRARLEGQRDALFAAIDRRLVAQLDRESRPDAQVLEDLDHLNELGPLPDGTYPLEIWLKNAAVLAGPRPEARLFQEVLARIDRTGFTHTLVVHGGARDGTRIYLREGAEHVLGRGRRATLKFMEDRRMSGSHAKIRVDGRVLHVRDLDSRHGVWVNEVRVAAAQVQVGHVIRCGRTVLVVEDGTTPATVYSDPTTSCRLISA